MFSWASFHPYVFFGQNLPNAFTHKIQLLMGFFFNFNLTVFNLFWAHILYKTVSAPILFYFNIAFAPLGSLQFHVNLMSCFSIYVRMGGEVLIEITYICTDLDSIDLSVCPLIQEHRMSSFLFGHFKFLSFILYIFQCTSLS